MKTKFYLLLSCVLFPAASIPAQSTAFTYQGRLQHAGSPANGLYEMYFTLYDALTNGNAVGTGVTVAPVAVSNGLFTASLDFGAAAFMGANRWLEIAVTVFNSDQPVTLLVPRQPLTPTPYALHAYNAAGLMSFGNAPLDIKVNGQRALRLEPTSDAPNVIGGSSNNSVGAGVVGAIIAGGKSNTVAGASLYTTISGGASNRIGMISAGSTLGGGLDNMIGDECLWHTISGGARNLIYGWGSSSTIGGGEGNRVGGDSQGMTIAGGCQNFAFGENAYATIGGGRGNAITRGANNATIAGGLNNLIGDDASASTIGGGEENTIQPEANNATVAGGYGNTVSGTFATVGGGVLNTNRSREAVIGGGLHNRILEQSFHSTISGGASNFMDTKVERSTIGGGVNNTIGYYANATTIAGGMNNVIDGVTGGSTISGGWFNHINEEASLVTIAGGGNNLVSDNAGSAVISGGEDNQVYPSFGTIGGGQGNVILFPGHYAAIAGGQQNAARDYFATVGGGGNNVASGFGAVVAGGGGIQFDDGNEPRGNTASGDWSAVGGGADNVASGIFSVIGGGEFNRASGINAMVPGGLDCEASGTLSFAAGWGAKALHHGAWMWADHSLTGGEPPLTSTTNNQFTARAAGGVRFFTDRTATTGAELAPGSGTWSSLSDRNAKENFAAANAREVLEKVAALPLASWNYKAQDKSVRHLGPMAQDFHAAFGLGESERTITTVDADGVALAAIQGLNEKLVSELKRRDAENAELKQSVSELKELVSKLVARVNGGTQ